MDVEGLKKARGELADDLQRLIAERMEAFTNETGVGIREIEFQVIDTTSIEQRRCLITGVAVRLDI